MGRELGALKNPIYRENLYQAVGSTYPGFNNQSSSPPGWLDHVLGSWNPGGRVDPTHDPGIQGFFKEAYFCASLI